MAILDNARHERFAQAVAKGQTVDEAYVTAGFKANRGNAARLNANESVVKRVAELLERAAAKTEISVASVTRRLLAIATKCESSADAPMLSVARASLMDAAKLNGLVVDKQESKIDARVIQAADDDFRLLAGALGGNAARPAGRPGDDGSVGQVSEAGSADA